MGLFGSSKSTSSSKTTVTTVGASDDSSVFYGSNNSLIDPGAFDLARLTVEQSGENFDTVVGLASQIEQNRAAETTGYRDQLSDSASEAIQRTAAGIQTAYQSATGKTDPEKIYIGLGLLLFGSFAVWRFAR